MPPRREIRVLNVAEKPSVAREITKHLGGADATTQNGYGSFVAEFPFTLRQTPCRMVVTAIRGHMLDLQFGPEYKGWKSHNPAALFQAPVHKYAPAESAELERNLQKHARQCQWLVLWLDCDREGEAIAFEVLEVCQRAAGGRLQVFRAVFSALTRADLVRACETLRDPDRRLADAVEARQEIDLRAGAAFTRFMTLRYQAMFPQLGDQPLSFGPCQFPTLGFVVDRWLRIDRFRPEPFWSIRLEAAKAGQAVKFAWRRGRLFDRLPVLALYELCVEEGAANGAIVTRVHEEPKTRWRPLPLNTVELTKLAATKLRMAPARCMHVAEDLYQRGLISYPRTETDRFPPTMDPREIIQEQVASSVWGGFAQGLLHAGRYTPPRSGPHDDHAHPPIVPVKCVEQGALGDESWRVYELVARHMLAACAPDARGNRTEVEAEVAGEFFVTSGLVVLDRGWLEVYPYSNWVNDPLPHFAVHERLILAALEMTESRTQPPPLLSEADLITLMDRTGIGTDATMHDHIQKIQTRHYALKNAEGRLEPSKLGVALVEGYKRFAAEGGLDLSKPELRAQMEQAMAAIARGEHSRAQFLNDAISATQRCYSALERNAPALDASLGQHFEGRSEAARVAPIQRAAFSTCRCGAALDLRSLGDPAAGGAPGGGGAAGGGGPGGGPGGGAGGGAARGRGGRAGRGGRLALRGRAASAGPGRGRGARGRGGAGAGRGRGGRGAHSAPPPARREPRVERFLVCPNGACGIVLPLPTKASQQFKPFPHVCPICRFQTIKVLNAETRKEHSICPYCFNHVPRDLHPDKAELRCFQCAHPTCGLAGGRSSGGPAPPGAGGPAGRGPPGPPAAAPAAAHPGPRAGPGPPPAAGGAGPPPPGHPAGH